MLKIKVLRYITFVFFQPKTLVGRGTGCMNQVVEHLNSNFKTEVGIKFYIQQENGKFGS